MQQLSLRFSVICLPHFEFRGLSKLSLWLASPQSASKMFLWITSTSSLKDWACVGSKSSIITFLFIGGNVRSCFFDDRIKMCHSTLVSLSRPVMQPRRKVIFYRRLSCFADRSHTLVHYTCIMMLSLSLELDYLPSMFCASPFEKPASNGFWTYSSQSLLDPP